MVTKSPADVLDPPPPPSDAVVPKEALVSAMKVVTFPEVTITPASDVCPNNTVVDEGMSETPVVGEGVSDTPVAYIAVVVKTPGAVDPPSPPVTNSAAEVLTALEVTIFAAEVLDPATDPPPPPRDSVVLKGAVVSTIDVSFNVEFAVCNNLLCW